MDDNKCHRFDAPIQWFHIMRALIESGDLIKISGYGLKVYVVIKAHCNFSTGDSFPSLETISAISGVSLAQVKRELQNLAELGYIAKSKKGRNNIYRLREKVEIKDDHGTTEAIGSWDYRPGEFKDAINELRNILLTGNFSETRIIKIERLQINFNNLSENSTVFNMQGGPDEEEEFIKRLENLPFNIKEKIINGWNASRRWRAKAEAGGVEHSSVRPGSD